MKSFFALAALAGLTLAQYDTNSAPFRLILTSSNSTLNGTALGACHEGAAIEGLCLTGESVNKAPTPYTTFYQATSSGSGATPSVPSPDGIIYWNLTISGGTNVPSALRLSQDYSSNVAIPIFMPGDSEYLAVYVDSQTGELYLPRWMDDTTSPPTRLSDSVKLMNWYICTTNYGYVYQTLAWKVGVEGEPQNPTCQPVGVRRVFN